jgi:hypothetical protein
MCTCYLYSTDASGYEEQSLRSGESTLPSRKRIRIWLGSSIEARIHEPP